MTIRDAKDCFHLYEVPASRVSRQVVGPRIPRSWCANFEDESSDLVDTDESESWITLDLLRASALPSNPCLSKTTAKLP